MAQTVSSSSFKVCLRGRARERAARANRIANVLVREMGLVPGNRVLLSAPNNPMLDRKSVV